MIAEKSCVIYYGRICNNCGECTKCDLDPNKVCDNCGKCLGGDSEEFRSIKYVVKTDDSSTDELRPEEAAIAAFLDEPLDLYVPEDIGVDQELQDYWERKLAESLRERPFEYGDDGEGEQPSVLRAVRKRRNRK